MNRDNSSPYVGNRPLLAAGKPELRHYKAVYAKPSMFPATQKSACSATTWLSIASLEPMRQGCDWWPSAKTAAQIISGRCGLSRRSRAETDSTALP